MINLDIPQSDKIEVLEERGWREEEFDYILQFLRTILLKRIIAIIHNIFADIFLQMVHL